MFRSGWMRAALRLCLAFLIVAVLAASWVPDSRMAQLRWIPAFIGEWADGEPTFRTGVAFFVLTMVAALALGNGTWSWTGSRKVLLLCFGCLLLAELGQLWVPNRTMSFFDLAWGCVGIAFGFPVGAMLSYLARALGKSLREFSGSSL